MGQKHISKTGSLIVFLLLSAFCFGQSGYVVDIDGNSYATVIIGGKIWFTENLKVTRFNDGTAITLNNSTDTAKASIWTNYTIPAYCWLNNDKPTMMANGYGALYNYHAVATAKLCPTGFRVPTKMEFDTLIKYAGGGNTAGRSLKTITGWNINNGANTMGFKALPAGNRWGGFINVGVLACFWSYDKYSPGTLPYPYGFSYVLEMVDYYTWAWVSNAQQMMGNSVRCVK